MAGLPDKIKNSYTFQQIRQLAGSPFEGIKPVEDFSEQFREPEKEMNPYTIYLEPREIAEAKREAVMESQKMLSDIMGREDPGKVTGPAKAMFEEALTQYSYIYSATAKVVASERNELEREKKALQEGQEKSWNYSYTDAHGNEIEQELGIKKDSKGNILYFKEPENPEEGQRTYISETAFMSSVSCAVRNKIKEERGLTEALYTIEDREGNRIMITDARDDNEKENSFNDGFAQINIYRIGKDGTKEQLTGSDLSMYVKELGLSERQIRMRDSSGKIFRSFEEIKSCIKREMAREAVRKPGKVLEDMRREAQEGWL